MIHNGDHITLSWAATALNQCINSGATEDAYEWCIAIQRELYQQEIRERAKYENGMARLLDDKEVG